MCLYLLEESNRSDILLPLFTTYTDTTPVFSALSGPVLRFMDMLLLPSTPEDTEVVKVVAEVTVMVKDADGSMNTVRMVDLSMFVKDVPGSRTASEESKIGKILKTQP